MYACLCVRTSRALDCAQRTPETIALLLVRPRRKQAVRRSCRQQCSEVLFPLSSTPYIPPPPRPRLLPGYSGLCSQQWQENTKMNTQKNIIARESHALANLAKASHGRYTNLARASRALYTNLARSSRPLSPQVRRRALSAGFSQHKSRGRGVLSQIKALLERQGAGRYRGLRRAVPSASASSTPFARHARRAYHRQRCWRRGFRARRRLQTKYRSSREPS